MTLDVFAAFYNVANVQEVTRVDSIYTFDRPEPIQDGNTKQLPYLTRRGWPVSINPNFGNATAYQIPFGAQFGARLKF